ncbi:hypothetical protein VPH35_034779 [Triticum aestivum]
MTGCNGNGNGNSSASTMGQQTVTEKKFGGIAPKKPLISKDHERAYFDSADWVLGKQAASNNAQAAAIESLKPKLKDAPSPAPTSQAGLRVGLIDRDATRDHQREPERSHETTKLVI